VTLAVTIRRNFGLLVVEGLLVLGEDVVVEIVRCR
jgi:hypothetical protein